MFRDFFDAMPTRDFYKNNTHSIAKEYVMCYTVNAILQGGVQFPTGGKWCVYIKARERFSVESVKFRCRRYSPDERSCNLAVFYAVSLHCPEIASGYFIY